MATRLYTDPDIDAYIADVVKAAQHHALPVLSIINPLEQGVRARLNLAIDTVHVYSRNGKTARTCWVVIGGNRWVFSYNYKAEQIELRKGGIRGPVVFQFDNSTPHSTLMSQIGAM